MVCAATNNPTLQIPKGKTFLLMPVKFQGPCKSQNINVQVGGDIIAPGELSQWANHELNHWLSFSNVNGRTVSGDGSILTAKGLTGGTFVDNIGCLGKDGKDDKVEEIHGGSGYARKITFENITFVDA
ncbi:putative polygalacturonase [Morus notabilis]|uniref:Putative polygalacturonase n=1 Tax=Morus notabilis TaxID=981085 RepID=W9R439_9ROSA|nr:putative polygalacturonase [Morus notabilis]